MWPSHGAFQARRISVASSEGILAWCRLPFTRHIIPLRTTQRNRRSKASLQDQHLIAGLDRNRPSRPAARATALRCLPQRRGNESRADPFFLDPDHLARADRRVACDHETKMRRHKGRVLHVDGGALGRDIPQHATHDRARPRNVGRFVDFGSLVFSSLFHRH